ncbi:MAG: LacI family transcriptional regulator [Actinomycetota bacterium]|nr:LacI family transcriptional regulator [Actinomycetota bacterium]
MGRATMQDVALRAGVSRALVSLVMRNSPRVSPQRRAAVFAAATELGYRPHAMARQLASRDSTVLGVLVSDLHNQFFADLVDGVDQAAHEQGFSLLLQTGQRRAAREEQVIDTLLSFSPAGLVLLGPVVATRIMAAAARQSPVIAVTRSCRHPDIDTVTDDSEAGARLAVTHLAGLGHRAIAHLDGGNGAQAALRRRGYRVAMAEAGLAPLIVRSEYTETGGVLGARALLSSAPETTAVFCSNDLNAVGAIAELEDHGLQVPADMSVVGYDNTALAALRHVSLTTVHQPRHEMGRLAVELLLDRIRCNRDTVSRLQLEPTLVVRKTTAAPRSAATAAVRAVDGAATSPKREVSA